LNSEDENESTLPPDVGEDCVVQVVTGDGFQVIQDERPTFSPQWKGLPTMAGQIRAQQQEAAMEVMIPDWMSKADRHMMHVDGKQPIPWELFCDQVRSNDDRVFAIWEQRRFEQCEVVPSPENDAIVGSALAV
jgi:hypothetical protein